MSPELVAYAAVLRQRLIDFNVLGGLPSLSAFNIGHWAAFAAFPAAPMLLTTLEPIEAASFCDGVANYYTAHNLHSLADAIK